MAAGFLSAGLIIGISAIFVIAACGRKLLGREGDPGEHFTGVLTASGIVAAFLAGNGIIQYRHHQLGIPFQPNDGELSQGYQQLPLSTGKYQRIVKQFPDTVGDLYCGGFTAAVICFLDFGRQHHGIQDLHC